MSLLEATSREVSHPVNGAVETFPKLSYADKAEILRAALKRAREAEMETLSAVGITGAAALPYLRKIDPQFRGDGAFIAHANSNAPDAGAGINDVFAFILRKKFPEATADQIEAAAESVSHADKFAIVLQACNLAPKPTEGEGDGSPLTGAGSGSSPATESGQTTQPA